LKGANALGTSFYVPIQSDNYSQTVTAYGETADQIDIVATEDNTSVTVTPKAAVHIAPSGTGAAGTPITKTLQKGETLKIMEKTINSGSLAGTSITSTKPIAVTVTEDLTEPGGDVAGDQIIPVNNLGRHYVIAKGYMTVAAYERVYMLAATSGTTIKVNGTTVTPSPLNAGETYVYVFPAATNTVFVEANNPIYCYQRTGYNEQGAALIPSMYSIAENKISYFQITAEYERAFVVFKTGTQSNFKISYGATKNATLSVGTVINIPGITEWECARFDLPTAANNQVVTIENLQSAFSLGYISANSSSAVMTSYGYLSGFGDFKFPNKTIYKCSGSSVTLTGGYAANYKWTYPDGTVSAGTALSSITATQPGRYILEMDQGSASTLKDTCYVNNIYFEAAIQQTPAVVGEITGTPVQFSVNMNQISGLSRTYSWSFPGCTPTTSTVASPSVTWSNIANKNVSLTLSYTATDGSVCDTTLTYQIKTVVNDFVMCGGETRTLTFNPAATTPYTYYWYNTTPPTGTGTGSYIATGNTCSFTKNTTKGLEYLYIRTHNGSTWENDDVYTVKVFLVPDSLKWTGATNSDWHNPANWSYPNNPEPTCTECATYSIPSNCTNILIPAGATRYPDLTTYATTIYSTPACNHIHFEHGSEVVRTDRLTYSNAYIKLTLNSNQWYMLSAPLRNFYVGDMYVNNPNPFLDGYFIEPMYFHVNNPETHQPTGYTWTGRFNNADELLTAGKGMAVWVDKQGTPYTNHDPVTFSFPKNDLFYYYYNDATTIVGQTGNLTRNDRYRFIYEPLAGDGYVPLAASPCSATGQPVLVGNPFMAHLDIEKFLTDNTGQLYDGYKIAYGVSTVNGAMKTFSTFKKVSGTWYNTDAADATLSTLIAPLQSFIVISKVAALTLNANIASTTTASAADQLRSGNPESAPTPVLDIQAIRGEDRSKALLLYFNTASNDYDPEEDSYALFPEENETTVMVYTRSVDGYALDINSIGSIGDIVPLGVRTSVKGEITLRFSGMESFGNTKIYLYDRQENQTIDLSLRNEYTFNKTDGALYLDDRFYLTLNSPTGIESLSASSISVGSSSYGIDILSKDGAPLRRLRITDMQGRLLVNEEHLSPAGYHYPVGSGIYIVRVSSDRETVTRKVIVKK
jgi:hypothetical protein